MRFPLLWISNILGEEIKKASEDNPKENPAKERKLKLCLNC